MKTRLSQALPHSKCEKTIGGKVLIAAPAARPIGKLRLIQFLPALCPKAHPSQSPQMFFIGRENSAAGLQLLNDFEGNVFMAQVQITGSLRNAPRAALSRRLE